MNGTIVEIHSHLPLPGWGFTETKITIQTECGELHVLDKRCVRIGNPQIGQKGDLQYRDYGNGSRRFFEII